MKAFIALTLVLSIVAANNDQVFKDARSSVSNDDHKAVIDELEVVAELPHFSYYFKKYIGHDDYGFLFEVTPIRGGQLILMQVLYTFTEPTVELESSLKKFKSTVTPNNLTLINHQFFKRSLTLGGEAKKDMWFVVLTFDRLIQRLDSPLTLLDSSADENERFELLMKPVREIFKIFESVSQDINVKTQKFNFADLFLVRTNDENNDNPTVKLLMLPGNPQYLCNVFDCLNKVSQDKDIDLSDLESVILHFINANSSSLISANGDNHELASKVIDSIQELFADLKKTLPNLTKSSQNNIDQWEEEAAPGIDEEAIYQEEFLSTGLVQHKKILI